MKTVKIENRAKTGGNTNKRDWLVCLDTNILLRVLVEGDSVQSKQSRNLLNAIEAGEYQAIIPGMVLAEVAWVLKSVYKVAKSDQVDILNAILTLENTTVVDDYAWPLAVELFNRYQLKYVDAVLLSLAGSRPEPTVIATFDAELLSLKVEGLNVVEPGDLV